MYIVNDEDINIINEDVVKKLIVLMGFEYNIFMDYDELLRISDYEESY